MWVLVILTFLLFPLIDGSVKNVLFVIVDDLRPAFEVYGGPAKTPHLHRLASTGAIYENAYAQIALCAPSRNSLLTSRRPATTKLYDFYSYWRTSSGNFTTLPQFLKERGFDTYSVGKVFHPGESSNFTDDYPYSWTADPWHPPSEEYKDWPVCQSQSGWRTNLVCPVKLDEQPGKTLPDIESTEEAVRIINSRRNMDKPFFLALGYHKPHVPFKFPQQYLDLYPLSNIELPSVREKPANLPEVAWNPWNDIRSRDDISALNVSYPFGPMPDDWAKLIIQAYLSSVSYVDHLLGKVLHALQLSGLDKNTVVIFLGDHGWSLGEHGEWAKFSNFDVALRVPLIINLPNITHGTRHADLVELVDLFPTIVDILNLPPPPACEGNSIDTLLCSEGSSFWSAERVDKKNAFSQYPRPGDVPTLQPNSDRPKLAEITRMGYSIKTKSYRYTLWVAWRDFVPDWTNIRGEELYDHQSDSGENNNLAANTSMENIMLQLRTTLLQHFSSK